MVGMNMKQRSPDDEPILELKDQVYLMFVRRRTLIVNLVLLAIWTAGLWGCQIYQGLGQNNILTTPKTAKLKKPTKSGLIPVSVHGLYGYVTLEGAWAVPPRFEAANPFANDGGAWVRYQGKYGRINATGEWLVQPNFDDLEALAANGLAKAKSNGKYGFINAKGEWVKRSAKSSWVRPSLNL